MQRSLHTLKPTLKKDPTLEGIDYSRLRIVDYINAEYGQAVGAGSETPFSEAVLKTPMKDNYIEPALKGLLITKFSTKQ